MNMDDKRTDVIIHVIIDDKCVMALEDIASNLGLIALAVAGEKGGTNDKNQKPCPRHIKRSEKNVVPNLDKIMQLGFQKFGIKALEPLSIKLGVSPTVLGSWKLKVDRGEILKARFNNVLKIANALHVGVDELIIKAN